jgi:addiction module antitoxin, relB/dinJ family
MVRSDNMTQISLRVDEEVKRNAEKTFNEIGLSMSTAINIFLKKVARENRIPFELSADPFYSRENMAELERRINSVRSGESTLKEHELIEVD